MGELADSIFHKLGRIVGKHHRNRTPLSEREIHERLAQGLEGHAKSVIVFLAFSDFLAQKKLWIPDEDLLPFPKSIIERSLHEWEQELCDHANSIVTNRGSGDLSKIEQQIEAIRTIRLPLVFFTQIKEKHKAEVDYFNKLIKEGRPIPEKERHRFDKLFAKYGRKGIKDSKKKSLASE